MQPRELVEEYFHIIQTGDLSRLDEILHPDVFDHVGQQAGIEWWKKILGMVRGGVSGSEETTTTIEHILVDGSLVAGHVVVRGVQRGRFLPQIGPVQPSGKPFEWQQVHIFRVADGLLIEHWAVRDDLGLAKQVGVRTLPEDGG